MSEKHTKDGTTRTVIHLEKDGKHYYYGCIANLYEHFTPKELGISYGSLRNYGLSPEKPYENARCIIRKGLLLSKISNRGRKSISDGENEV